MKRLWHCTQEQLCTALRELLAFREKEGLRPSTMPGSIAAHIATIAMGETSYATAQLLTRLCDEGYVKPEREQELRERADNMRGPWRTFYTNEELKKFQSRADVPPDPFDPDDEPIAPEHEAVPAPQPPASADPLASLNPTTPIDPLDQLL